MHCTILCLSVDYGLGPRKAEGSQGVDEGIEAQDLNLRELERVSLAKGASLIMCDSKALE
jgi:hypothetical protein